MAGTTSDGVVMAVGTTGVMADYMVMATDGAGTVGIDGIAGTTSDGVVTVAGDGTTGVTVAMATQTLGVHLSDMAMQIKGIMAIEDMLTTQEDVVM